ncbi:MAG: methylenetetrahydrofolate--tRNA-(uracil(54)-C(5))-methyltransferase (FADH(2)-oxidizing) TrmFO, partial [Synergistales bacterium]|nr:methylenetetrahydrofolate--tRNA-(uracil(54)-C(5))-methyltransferase (FADH(2)-oxidizing) TrmFO [Synergistales bacterium]
MVKVTVIGAGLAGSEAAWQLAQRGIPVNLVEMRPQKRSPAHHTDFFAELVCSNSLGGDTETTPGGILKRELRRLGSLIMDCADRASVPAGKALAVDREGFARTVTEKIKGHPLIDVVVDEVEAIPSDGPVIMATGPLTSEALASDLGRVTGQESLFFYDAAAPLVLSDTIDMSVAYRKDRYSEEGGGDYINCPMTEEQYLVFYQALISAERAPRHDFEAKIPYFESCMPVEALADRGVQTLCFGPLKPVGLEHPDTGQRPFAVVQLRQDNSDGTVYNLVGFQTNLRWGEQERVFRLIPGLENVEFVRKGVMHRNIYVNAPEVLDRSLRVKGTDNLRLAGQITGVEGYVESVAMGMVSSLAFAAELTGRGLPKWPRETAIGSLIYRLGDDTVKKFQPTNVNLGIFPKLEARIKQK